MTLEFLSPLPDRPVPDPPLASSPLEPWLREAGAQFTERDGWRVAIAFGAPTEEIEALTAGVGVLDRSHQGTLELQGTPEALGSLLSAVVPGGPPGAGETTELDGALLWLASPDRALALCESTEIATLRGLLESVCGASPHCGLVDLTAGFAGIELRGPRARALLERLTAIDVRPGSLPVGGVRAGAVAEVPATLLRPAADVFLMLIGAQEAPDAWEIILDAGAPLGARPVGTEARAAVSTPAREAPARA
jgi:heterotetrameric sarcosine oxidase gamma subunit